MIRRIPQARSDRRRSEPERLRQSLGLLRLWISEIWDPIGALRALRNIPGYLGDLRKYRRMGGDATLTQTMPRLLDKTASTPFDAHYFYMSAWATRKLREVSPTLHVDVGGPVALAAVIATHVPVVFVDYRPLVAAVEDLICTGADIVRLPFSDRSIESLSCLHVAEHIGLGRYGDPLDPAGTTRAAGELLRVLAPGGNLFFAVPIGRPGVRFNAHRLHSVSQIVEMFERLRLVELSWVTDEGRFLQMARPDDLAGARYACGLFWFRRD